MPISCAVRAVMAERLAPGIEHQPVRALAVDQHRRPDAADAIAARRRHVLRLGRLDDDLGEFFLATCTGTGGHGGGAAGRAPAPSGTGEHVPEKNAAHQHVAMTKHESQ